MPNYGIYSLKNCHKTFGQGLRPPLFGQRPKKHSFSCRGASLSLLQKHSSAKCVRKAPKFVQHRICVREIVERAEKCFFLCLWSVPLSCHWLLTCCHCSPLSLIVSMHCNGIQHHPIDSNKNHIYKAL